MNIKAILGGAALLGLSSLGCSATSQSTQIANARIAKAPIERACETENQSLRPQWKPQAGYASASDIQWHPQVRMGGDSQEMTVANWRPSVQAVEEPIRVAGASCENVPRSAY